MRAVVQRATRGAVRVAGEVVGQITRPGLVVLVAAHVNDTAAEVDLMARKIAQLRLSRDETSVSDDGAPVLLVSQFTLYGSTRKGRRPSWSESARGDVAEPLFDALVEALRAQGVEVQTGRFGADMEVELVNDGPFTVIVDV
ncbi:D-aminoacyl-tRNA deacylase [Dermatophilus congolensis]|uniref:D-aminoacyl-tRNA deacylase n=1 Tax=Dermatophilus congolensis TaxID=1863 RepID=A0AA46BLI5_9MICO|nr:D-aminoacyl-tRNA deacylase [Dermatophilus congolensis]MBO3142059.1 D-tyrosyl-tRNA(Tyr) deacylase [Dermatophilus congolensis]MBO3151051.1 D-tyrosyl-tRNA(Tyr) deacylase [Dermatophilus congolensis]MBO3161945.1 D-tyrosyl-tRNA(Tyr) deacylase [Dermatophilus congolensis]MBO3162336.1 D-tyrosyl-tRNA(Tyr) deacylase [Dermatophilus congolensis]MBO3175891.1 D-tyrosyl-tRNA(Tyr) deacylase [Dermatophilus congolensis]